MPRRCPNCGSPRLFSQRAALTAIHRIDDERSVSGPLKPLQVHCKACDFLVNDDVNGDTAVVYARLAEMAGGATPVQVTDEVAAAVLAARRLPTLPDAERQRDYDKVRASWGCAGLLPIAEDELQDTMTNIFHGYLAEGAHRVTVQTLDQGIVMIAFFSVTGFRPVRLARGVDGDFVAYGQIQLYRILGAL